MGNEIDFLAFTFHLQMYGYIFYSVFPLRGLRKLPASCWSLLRFDGKGNVRVTILLGMTKYEYWIPVVIDLVPGIIFGLFFRSLFNREIFFCLFSGYLDSFLNRKYFFWTFFVRKYFSWSFFDISYALFVWEYLFSDHFSLVLSGIIHSINFSLISLNREYFFW